LKIQRRDWREKIPIKPPAKYYQAREINLPEEYQKPSEAAWGWANRGTRRRREPRTKWAEALLERPTGKEGWRYRLPCSETRRTGGTWNRWNNEK